MLLIVSSNVAYTSNETSDVSNVQEAILLSCDKKTIKTEDHFTCVKSIKFIFNIT